MRRHVRVGAESRRDVTTSISGQRRRRTEPVRCADLRRLLGVNLRQTASHKNNLIIYAHPPPLLPAA